MIFNIYGDPSLRIVPPQGTIHVDWRARGTVSGSCWEDAYNDIQDALVAAKPGTEIHVAQGTYMPVKGSGVSLKDRTASFQLRDGVIIKGGYAGLGGSDPNMRDVGLYNTILSGDIGAIHVDSDNTYHVVKAINVGSTAVLDGFTITGGCADGDGTNGCGGGIYVRRGSPTIIDCFFVDNYGNYGGGMCNYNYSNPTLVNCTFSGNSADDAGGMANEDHSSPTLKNCVFSGNRAQFSGGGIRNKNSCYPILTDCTVNDNWARHRGGGLWSHHYSKPRLVNCTVSNNSVVWYGGGMWNGGSNAILTNCIIVGNSSTRESGGGMYNVDSNPMITDCTFTENWVKVNGGGIYNTESSPKLTNCFFSANSARAGGAIYNDSSSPSLANCILRGNSAEEYGGGIENIGSSPTLTNCTFSTNSASIGGGMDNYKSIFSLTNCIFKWNSGDDGGGMSNYESRLVLSNCTISENRAQNGPVMACNYYKQSNPSTVTIRNCIIWNGPRWLWNNDGSIVTATYSDIQTSSLSEPGEGNINADPLFADPENGDFHLKSQTGRWSPIGRDWAVDPVTSPCIDAGNPRSPVGEEPKPNGGRINMGAYGGTSEASKSIQ